MVSPVPPNRKALEEFHGRQHCSTFPMGSISARTLTSKFGVSLTIQATVNHVIDYNDIKAIGHESDRFHRMPVVRLQPTGVSWLRQLRTRKSYVRLH